MSRFQQLREMHNGPPVNLEEIIRGLDIELDKRASLRDEISGILERMADGYRILVNSNQHYFRQRFTMAHELAHYLLHLDLIGDGIADDKVFRSKDTGIYKNSLITEKHEREANALAASILMPEKLIREHYAKDNDVTNLARKFQTSIPAMEFRLRNLNLVQKQTSSAMKTDASIAT